MSMLRICLSATVVVSAIACGGTGDPASSSTTMRLTGTVDRSALTLDNAKAVALAANGKVYSAYLDRSGHFTLDLPPNAAYHVSIANTTSKGQLRLLGHIVNTTSFGQTSWLGIHSAGRLPLGIVSTASAKGGLHSQCSCGGGSGGGSGGGDTGGSSGSGGSGGGDHSGGGDSSGEPDDDYKCHENDGDGDKSCSDSSGGTDDVDLHADNEPGDTCDSSDVDTDEDKPEHTGHHSCGGSSGGGGGGGGGGGDTVDAGSSGGGGGGSCHCTSQCAEGETCVASKCTTPTPPTPPTPPAAPPMMSP